MKLDDKKERLQRLFEEEHAALQKRTNDVIRAHQERLRKRAAEKPIDMFEYKGFDKLQVSQPWSAQKWYDACNKFIEQDNRTPWELFLDAEIVARDGIYPWRRDHEVFMRIAKVICFVHVHPPLRWYVKFSKWCTKPLVSVYYVMAVRLLMDLCLWTGIYYGVKSLAGAV